MAKKNHKFVLLSIIILALFIGLQTDFTSVFATEHPQDEEAVEYPIVKRYATYEETQLTDKRFIQKLGLPTHILDNQGDYVPSLSYNNTEGIELESGTISYYFDKEYCSMSLFKAGRINSTSVPSIKGDMWVVKSALNGTDTWTDVSQNNLPCVVTDTVGEYFVEINSTKSDVNGTITEIYRYDQYKGLKHTLYFTNNDSSLNNHKFSFSNILLDTPKSFSIHHMDNDTLTWDRYSLYEGDLQPNWFGGNAVVLLSNATATPIIYNATQFAFNGTQQVNGFEFLFDDEQDKTRTISYDYKTAFDKLWAVTFQPQTDFTLDVYVDYANVTSTLPVGQTTTLDPEINFPITTARQLVYRGVAVEGGSCATGNDNAASETTLFQHSVGASGSNQSPETCKIPYLFFDISSIPDLATPIRGTFSGNLTSSSTFVVTSIASGGVFLPITEENLSQVTTIELYHAIVDEGNTGNDNDASNILETAVFSIGTIHGRAGVVPIVLSQTQTSELSQFRIQFEAQLESGKDYFQLVLCPSSNINSGCNDSTNFAATGFGTFAIPNPATFFEVEFEFLAPPDAPTDITATFSASPDKCTVDWESPLFDGGRPILGFQIERDSGAGFGILEANTGSQIPTNFDDTTIVAGISFKYRVSAINAEGVGAVSEVSNNCGVPELSSAPLGVVAQNAALGVVGLDWNLPFFDGNSPITGYRVERSAGAVSAPSDSWNWREHSVTAVDSALQWLNKCVVGLAEPQCESGGGVEINDRTDAAGIATEGVGSDWLFFSPPLNADFVNGLNLAVTWQGTTNVGNPALHQILVFDGTYDRTSQIDFPDNATRALKGTGLLQTCFSGGTFGLTTTNCVLDTSASTEAEVTIFIQKIQCNGCSGLLRIDKVNIANYNLWDFNQAATIVVRQVQATRSDHGFATAGITTFDPTAQEGFKVLSADTGSTLREFLDDAVRVDTEYGYRIAAINGEGTSPFSNVAIITTVGLPPPPENVSATPTGTSTIRVQWTAAVVGDTTIEGYQIDRKLGVGGVFSTIQPFTGNTNTIFDDALLAAGTEYCYRLKTFTNIGLSETFSNEDCATTFDQADPPANMTATAIDGSTINVSWDTPPDDGGAEITGYKIERQKQSDPFQILFAERQPESNRVLIDTNREVGTTYTYRVSGITSFGQGETAQTSATTDATPQAPQNFACSPASSTAINLSWTTPLSFSAPTGYQIDRKLFGDGGFSTIVGDTFSTDTTFQDSGLPLETVFVYRILGKTSEGDTDFTPEITCSTLTAPDFPPENVRGDFSEVIPHQTVLAWDIPNTFGIPITEFRIERDDGTGYSSIASVSGSSNAFIDQVLDNDIDQKYRIITVGTEGETVPSIAVPFDANQTSHWHYENTIDDTGFNKNSGTIFGIVNFNGTGHIGKGFIFNNTRIEVDPSQESDYDFDRLTPFGITSYYRGQEVIASLFDDEWQLREQSRSVSDPVVLATFFRPSFLSVDMAPSISRGHAIIFKVFDKVDIINKNLSVTWAGTVQGAGSADMRLHVLDGSYDRNNATDFLPDAGIGFTVPLKGAGQLHFVNHLSTFSTTTDVINMTLAGSTEPQITIALVNRVSSFNTIQFMDITKIEIIGTGGESWIWDSSATVTMEVIGTNDDKGVTNANYSGSGSTGNQVIVSKAQTLTDIGYKFFIDSLGRTSVKLTNTDGTNEIFVRDTTSISDNTLHFIGFGYNGNGTASGITMNIDGSAVTPTIIIDSLSGSILNNNPLTIGGTSTGTSFVSGTLDETRIFGSGTLDDEQLDEVAEDKLSTTAPINATMTIDGSTFANISGELVTIQLVSGFPSPSVGTIDLNNFTATQVNNVTPTITIDPLTGEFIFDRFFNVMGSLSNYTADTTLTNTLEAFPLLSNFDIQTPVFTFLGDFFFQQARNPTFDILSFNFTSTQQPFDLSCNLKSELFEDGTTFDFTNVFFVQALFDVPPQTDVVVACIDPSIPPIDPTAPSFGGSNALLSFVSFGGNTGIGNFLQFTANYGDFFGAGLPFLFIIILAAAFTGRSAPTGIIIIGISLGAMWFLGIIEQDPVMWGIIIVLIVLGALGGKKFL